MAYLLHAVRDGGPVGPARVEAGACRTRKTPNPETLPEGRIRASTSSLAAGRPTPCPLSLAAGRRPPQSGKDQNWR